MTATLKSLFLSDFRKEGMTNPRFEGYKLNLAKGEAVDCHSVRLPSLCGAHVFNSKNQSASALTYRRLEARANFNHLFVDSFNASCAFYFDHEYRVVLIHHDHISKQVQFSEVCRLPPPTLVAGKTETEYASLTTLDSCTLLISDGCGALYIAKWDSATKKCHLLQSCVIESDRIRHRILLSSMPMTQDEGCFLTLAYHIEDVATTHSKQTGASTKKESKFTVELLLITMPKNEGDSPHITIVASAFGRAAPHMAFIELPIPSHPLSFVVVSDGPYSPTNPALPSLEPNFQQTHPSTKISTALQDTSSQIVPGPQQPPPYAWLQTESDVTLILNLNTPTPLTKHNIACRFTPTHVYVNIKPTNNTTAIVPTTTLTTALIPAALNCNAPRGRALFDEIVPSESLWTLERGRCLTLHLQKRHEGTRWVDLFDSHMEGVDDQVEETMDPNQVAMYLENLDKYTASLHQQQHQGQQVRHQPVLNATTETAEEEDFEGFQASIVRFQVAIAADYLKSDNQPLQVTELVTSAGSSWLCSGFPPVAGDHVHTLCVRSDVDGIIYLIGNVEDMTSSQRSLSIEHIGTLDAFGYVQASKRDKLFLKYTRNMKFAMILEVSGRMYVYEQSPQSQRTMYSNQFMVETGVKWESGNKNDVVGFGELGLGNLLLVLREQDLSVLSLK